MVLENKEKKMGIEIQFLDWLQTLHSPIVDKMMLGITHLGDAGIFWIVLAVILLLIPKTRKSGLIVAAALCIDVIVCNGILKNLFARTRPFDVNEAVQLLITAPKDLGSYSGKTRSLPILNLLPTSRSCREIFRFRQDIRLHLLRRLRRFILRGRKSFGRSRLCLLF